jgi:hypothetical protein
MSLAAALLMLSALQAAEPNACTNGSFEALGAQGFPVDWAPLGRVEVSADAHTGGRSLRLIRSAADKPGAETGLNRGRLIEPLRGAVNFWYKAVSADGAALRLYVIPVGAEGIENTGSPRAAFAVPASCVGDGLWHHGRLKYDFSKNAAARRVHFAARIEGKAGHLLLDDIAWIEQAGPILRIGTVRVEEDAVRPGRRCRLFASVENGGDRMARDVRVTLTAPAGLVAAPTEVRLGDLDPDAKKPASWTAEGERTSASKVALTARAGTDPAAAEPATASLDLVGRLVLRNFGPTAPVAKAGEPVVLECALTNPGGAIVLRPTAQFSLGTERLTATAAEVAPGRSVVLSATFRPVEEDPAAEAAVQVAAANVPDRLAAKSRLIVGSARPVPSPARRLTAEASGEIAVLANESIALVFRRNRFGFGPGELIAKTDAGPQTVAWLPHLCRLLLQGAGADRTESGRFTADPPTAENPAGGPARIRFDLKPSTAGNAKPLGRLTVTFELASAAKMIAAAYEFVPQEPRGLLCFEGPMLYALRRQEAVFPGVEWLVDDEVSSDAVDIAEGHPDRVRYVVHPQWVTIPAVSLHSRCGTVGMLWDVHQRWDGQRDRPSVVFASPDRFENQRSHLAGLFLPTVPEFVAPNTRVASKPYPLAAGRPIVLRAWIFADGTSGDPLAVIDQWMQKLGLPKPAPLPRATYPQEIEFSMQGYLRSLWDPAKKEWWPTKGGGMMSASKDRPRSFVADLLVGEALCPSPEVRRQCRDRAEEVLAMIGGAPRIDAQRFPGPMEVLVGSPDAPAALLSSRQADGTWRFDADQAGTGPFVGADYRELGPDNALEVGLCARKAYEVLRFARVTGDSEAYRQMQPTLERMEGFRVPRAAQVWEVPVHTPDILAAADALDAYLEAYRFGRDPRWLRDAVVWARRGLPFVYLWEDPERPFLVGASIPVFGASWMQGSWFGRPVQWNGLRYAESLLRLADHDSSLPWRQLAETVIRSAIHQQNVQGEDVALWPDNLSAIDGSKCPWVFSPQMIVQDVLRLMGRDPEPTTVIVGDAPRRLHITAAAAIADASWDGQTCCFRATYPPGEQGVAVVFNVARPAGVLVDGNAIGERGDLEKDPAPGWRYNEALAALAVRIGREGASAVRIEGAAWRHVERLPALAERIAFEFEDGLEGWTPAHDVSGLSVGGGMMKGRITGQDPYIVRTMLRARGDASPVVRVRMRVTAGQGGEFFWTTLASRSFGEDKKVGFPLTADGQLHEYRLEVGRHPLWSGQTITAIRIDPGNGAAGADFAIDHVRGGAD